LFYRFPQLILAHKQHDQREGNPWHWWRLHFPSEAFPRVSEMAGEPLDDREYGSNVICPSLAPKPTAAAVFQSYGMVRQRALVPAR